MANVYITEFARLAGTPDGPVQIPQDPALANQFMATAGASAQTNAFNVATQLIRVHTDGICAIDIGTNPTAVATAGPGQTRRLAANQTEYFAVPAGQSFKLAAITST